jgi:ribosomal protein S18 acetylase RimI-like enzyme
MIADAEIRFATDADAAQIAALSRDNIERGLPWSWREERVRGAIHDRDTNVVVVGKRGVIEGFGIMYYTQDDAHLLLFAVRPDRRRRGIGSALLQWLETVAINAGATRIRVECRRDNDVARNFYADHGYHERDIAKGMYRGIADGIHLQKQIGAAPE